MGKNPSHANWGGTILFFSFLVLTGCDLKPGGELFFCRLFFLVTGRLLWAGMVQALARCLRRHTFSVRAAVPVDTRTAPIVNGAVIMAVRTKASGLMPAMGVPRTRTTMTKIVIAAISAAPVLAIRIVQR